MADKTIDYRADALIGAADTMPPRKFIDLWARLASDRNWPCFTSEGELTTWDAWREEALAELDIIEKYGFRRGQEYRCGGQVVVVKAVSRRVYVCDKLTGETRVMDPDELALFTRVERKL